MELFAKNRPVLAKETTSTHASFHVRSLFRFLLGIIVLAGLCWGGLKLHDAHTLPIQSIKIEGDYTRLDHDALQQAILPFLKGNIFTLNIMGLKESLLQLPWVYTASVARVWPDTVVVHIVQQTAVARWQEQGLLNAAGEVFTPSVDTFPEGLPLLRGPDGQQAQVWPMYQEMTALLAPLGLRISSLDLSARQAWRLQLTNGMTVVLGRMDPLKRLHRLVDVYAQLIGGHEANVLSIDLRYPSGMAVSWR